MSKIAAIAQVLRRTPFWKWPFLVVTTINVGAASDERILRTLRKIRAEAGKWPDVILGQEFGDRASLKRKIIALGYWIQEGTGQSGQGSTPAFFRKDDMEPGLPWHIRLLGHVFGGKGAGPSWIKPKWADGERPKHKASGRWVRAASVHGPASQENPLRFALFRKFVTRLLNAAVWKVITIIGGDWNTKDQQLHWLTQIMQEHGWTSSDIESSTQLVTHGDHLYDMIWWRKTRLLHFVRQFVIKASDHYAKTAIWRVKPKWTKR